VGEGVHQLRCARVRETCESGADRQLSHDRNLATAGSRIDPEGPMNVRETATELLCAALEGGLIRLRAPDAPIDPRADARAIGQAWRTLAKSLRKGEPKGDDEDTVKAPKAAKGAAKARARARKR
jgi:hypothetical protein